MRIITLNVWQGKLRPKLFAFLEREAHTTDIFCFQEMINVPGVSPDRSDLFSRVVEALPDFQGFFESAEDKGNGIEMGLAIFVKRMVPVDEEGDFFVYRTRNAMVGDDGRTLGKNIQFVEFPRSGKEVTVINFHGIWMGDGRKDTEDRITQAKKMKEFLRTIDGAKIVCGDFNLTRDTQSLAILDEGMRNLIKEAGAISTRPEKYFPYPDKFCDYILVDNNVTVKHFEVMPDIVSDHLALLLDFE